MLQHFSRFTVFGYKYSNLPILRMSTRFHVMGLPINIGKEINEARTWNL